MADAPSSPPEPYPTAVAAAHPGVADAAVGATWHRLAIEFGGSGSEYFRIWVVNLLLTLATLGVYYPWARVREWRYFYGTTTVGGHALGFHGDPKRMFRGYGLAAALLLLYGFAVRPGTTADLVALLIMTAVWPALVRSAQQFRLANTSWRGLRFRFVGSLRGAYAGLLPASIPYGLAMLAIPLLLGPDDRAPPAVKQGGIWLLATAGAAGLLVIPLMLWTIKKYQHDNVALGPLRTVLRAGPASFYAVALKAVVFCLPLAIGLLVAIVAMGGTLGDGNRAERRATASVLVVGGFIAVPLVLFGVVPFVTSRLQNLVWNRTRGEAVRFESDLRFRPLFGLTLANWLLTLLTLGLYIPFARIAMARLRLQAVTAYTLQPPDTLASTLRQRADDASGDAAGDLFGIDIGL